MAVWRRRLEKLGWLALLTLAPAACSDDSTSSAGPDGGTESPCAPGEVLEGSICAPAGLPADMPCPPGEWMVDGTCTPAGVAPGGCAQGFAHDGDRGCAAVLPANDCAEGTMAVPGDADCHPPATCGSGTWGDAPIGADTQYVDASYLGADSDGSATKPWKTIGEAIAAAADGALVAIAAGSYAEDLLVENKSVRLWGRCPEEVEIVGSTNAPAAVLVETNASGSRIASLAVRGPRMGILVSGSTDVVIERSWIHDLGHRGVDVEDTLGPASLEVRDSLIEKTRDSGGVSFGASLTLDRTVIRDTSPFQNAGGEGCLIQHGKSEPAPTKLTIKGSLLERNHKGSIAVLGGELTLESSVVRRTLLDTTQTYGLGVGADVYAGGLPKVTVRGSVLEDHHGAGIEVTGGDATIESTTIRRTALDGGGIGYGILVSADPETSARASLTLTASLVDDSDRTGVALSAAAATLERVAVRNTTGGAVTFVGSGIAAKSDPKLATAETALAVRGCLVEGAHEAGIASDGMPLTIEGTLVRRTELDAMGLIGTGIGIKSSATTGRGTLDLRASSIEGSHATAVLVARADATVSHVVVEDTQPDGAGLFGRAFDAENLEDTGEPVTGTPTTLALSGVLIDGSRDAAVFSLEAAVTLDGCLIRNTMPNAGGGFGNGVAAIAQVPAGTAGIVRTRIEQSARAAVATYGAAVTIADSAFACQALDITVSEFGGQAFAVDDGGGNLCGCPDANAACARTGATGEVPAPIGGLE